MEESIIFHLHNMNIISCFIKLYPLLSSACKFPMHSMFAKNDYQVSQQKILHADFFFSLCLFYSLLFNYKKFQFKASLICFASFALCFLSIKTKPTEHINFFFIYLKKAKLREVYEASSLSTFVPVVTGHLNCLLVLDCQSDGSFKGLSCEQLVVFVF